MATVRLVDEAWKFPPSQRIDLIETMLATLTEPDPESNKAWAHVAGAGVAAYVRADMKAVDFDQALSKHDTG